MQVATRYEHIVLNKAGVPVPRAITNGLLEIISKTLEPEDIAGRVEFIPY